MAKGYFDLLREWCDGMLSYQIQQCSQPTLYGGLLCPGCGIVHGRCADAAYPLLCLAENTGEDKYLRAACDLQKWSDNVTRSDGSWNNSLSIAEWKGITVFGALALGESLRHHGAILDRATRERWTERLKRAGDFLMDFMTFGKCNVNYPVTCSGALAVCGKVLDEPKYLERAGELARESLSYFTPNGLLYGEGRPIDKVTAKGCRPVDLGYNVEESLGGLAIYGRITGDEEVLSAAANSLAAHLEFMLPDGAWDNSWGSRSYKWTYWGSRTSDGAQIACCLLDDRDPRFAVAAWRNMQLMAECTHGGLLHAGPHLHLHGEAPCIHHTFTHAKAIATVVDYLGREHRPDTGVALLRDTPTGVRHFPEIGTYLVGIGPWRATVTEYDWVYPRGGLQPSGGAISLLYHEKLGLIFAAGLTEYAMIEPMNQQLHRDESYLPLTPRISLEAGGKAYQNVNDLTASLRCEQGGDEVKFVASGRLVDVDGYAPPGGEIRYELFYRLSPRAVEIRAAVRDGGDDHPAQLILPVISLHDEGVSRVGKDAVRIAKASGKLTVRTDATDGFTDFTDRRVFNLVPGLEGVPLRVALRPDRHPVTVSIYS